MNDFLTLTLAGAAGAVLGAIFFGGLWWTVRRGMTSPRPVLWFFGSLLVRMGIAVTGFYFVGNGDWRRLMVCLLGFLVARIIVTRMAGSPVDSPQSQAGEVRDAS